MTKVTINGQTFTVADGSNVSVVNGNIIINSGGNVQNLGDSGDHKVVIEGSTGELKVDKGSVLVKGNVNGSVYSHGSVSCCDVTHSVQAGGSVSCDDIGGNVQCKGSVSCDDISGTVTAGGSISRG